VELDPTKLPYPNQNSIFPALILDEFDNKETLHTGKNLCAIIKTKESLV